jgi:heme exporter protein D
MRFKFKRDWVWLAALVTLIVAIVLMVAMIVFQRAVISHYEWLERQREQQARQ